jgi:hypothetical protein
MWFAMTLAGWFVASWAFCVVHFLLLPFGISDDWPPLFFDMLALTICVGSALNPIIHLGFDTGLRSSFFAYTSATATRLQGRAKMGSVVSNVSVTPVSGRDSGYHGGSLVSTLEPAADASVEKDDQLEDARSRERIKEIMFSRNTGSLMDNYEDRDLDALVDAEEMIDAVEPTLTARKRISSHLVSIESVFYKRRGMKRRALFGRTTGRSRGSSIARGSEHIEGGSVFDPDGAPGAKSWQRSTIKATATVRAPVEDVVAFVRASEASAKRGIGSRADHLWWRVLSHACEASAKRGIGSRAGISLRRVFSRACEASAKRGVRSQSAYLSRAGRASAKRDRVASRPSLLRRVFSRARSKRGIGPRSDHLSAALPLTRLLCSQLMDFNSNHNESKFQVDRNVRARKLLGDPTADHVPAFTTSTRVRVPGNVRRWRARRMSAANASGLHQNTRTHPPPPLPPPPTHSSETESWWSAGSAGT